MSRRAMGGVSVCLVWVSVLLLAGEAGAQTFEPVNLSRSGRAQSPRIAVDSAGKIINVVWEDKSSGILYSRSVDGGLTFSAPRNLSNSATNSVDPQLAVDSAGTIHVAWRENNAGDYELFYTRSTDSGVSFTAATKIPGTMSVYDLRMAVDSNRNIGLLYVDDNSHIAWETTSVVFTHSMDGGSTFSSRTLQTGGYPFPGRPRMALGADNSVNLVWIYDQDGNDQIYFSRSTDGGVTFDPPVWIARGGVDFVNIAVAPNGNIGVIWSDNGWSDYGATAGTYFARSTDHGATWPSPSTLASGYDYYSPCPDITADPLSNFDAAWTEETGNISFGGGTDFSVVTVLTHSGRSNCPLITLEPAGAINVLWDENESQLGYSQVFYSRSTDSGATFSTPDNLSNSLGNAWISQVATDGSGKMFAVWTDWAGGDVEGDVFFSFYPDTLSAEFKLTVADECTRAACGSFASTGTVTSTSGLSCSTLPCTATFSRDSEVALSATPTAGSTFVGWAGACSGTGGCTVKMNASRIVSARFELPSFTLNVTRTGAGSGTITSDPAGLYCDAVCSYKYSPGTVVTLTAASLPSSTFLGWSGDCSGTGTCTITMDAVHSVTANFVRDFTLTLKLFTIDTGGRVTSDPAGIDCGMSIDWTICTATFAPGTLVTLTAIRVRASLFAGWSGACSGNSTVCAVTMNSDLEVQAIFGPKPEWTLQVRRGGTGSGTISSNFGNLLFEEVNTFYEGETVVLGANAAVGSLFAGWSAPCSGTGTCSISGSTDEFYSVTANFDTVPDDVAPTISITAPASGATVSGSSVVVSAAAADNVGVAGVQFELDGVNLGAEDAVAPFLIVWDTTQSTNGAHTLVANARDGAGNHGTGLVTVMVSNNPPPDTVAPTVTITSHTSGSLISGTSVALAATATDNIGIAGVQFRLDGINVGAEDTAAPFGVVIDTTLIPNGTHSLTALARDPVGNIGVSDTVALGVNNSTEFAISPVSGSPISFTAPAGSSVNFSLAIAPTTGFTGLITFACTNLPPASTCTVTPNPASISGTAITPITVTIATTARSSAGLTRNDLAGPFSTYSGLLWVVLAFAVAPYRQVRRASKVRVLSIIVICSLLAIAIACGGGAITSGTGTTPTTPSPTQAPFSGTPAGTYTVTLSGASAGIAHTLSITLTVN